MNEVTIRKGDRVQFNTATKFNGLRGTAIYVDTEGQRPVYLIALDNPPLASRFTTAHKEDLLRLCKAADSMAFPQSRGAFGGMTKREDFAKAAMQGILASGAIQRTEDIAARAYAQADAMIAKGDQ